jgi:hypothetical protein
MHSALTFGDVRGWMRASVEEEVVGMFISWFAADAGRASRAAFV